MESWAADLVSQFATYTEISPSGTGVKLITRGKIPSAVTKTDEIEMYSDGRYFALTGRSLNGDTIRPAQEQLDWWYKLLTVKRENKESSGTGPGRHQGRSGNRAVSTTNGYCPRLAVCTGMTPA